MKIIPSIASSNLMNIEQELSRIESNYENIYIDIEDGNFIPNITFGMSFIRQLRELTDKKFSVHLMTTKMDQYIDELIDLQCSHIFIHVENQQYLKPILQKIRKNNIKTGLAFNPVSNYQNYHYLNPLVDCLLFMTSEPEMNEQHFDDNIVGKLPVNSSKEIWIDGGVSQDVLKGLSQKVKIDYAVMGREIFYSSDPKAVLKKYNF